MLNTNHRRETTMHQRATIGVTLVIALSLLTASPAAAHGISGDATERSTLGFISVGIEHMLLGWDHLLFIAGVLLVARDLRRSAKLISIFALGHSLTVICATTAGWHVNADLVDVVIVLSVAFVGGVGLFGQPKRWDLFGAAIFCFGLIHGLGLATRLQSLGLPGDGLIWKVICFNIGVEIGQVTAIVGMLGLAAVVAMAVGRARENAAIKTAAVVLFNIGAIAAPVMAYNGFTAPPDRGRASRRLRPLPRRRLRCRALSRRPARPGPRIPPGIRREPPDLRCARRRRKRGSPPSTHKPRDPHVPGPGDSDPGRLHEALVQVPRLPSVTSRTGTRGRTSFKSIPNRSRTTTPFDGPRG